MISKYFSPNLKGYNSLNLGCVVPSPGIPEAEQHSYSGSRVPKPATSSVNQSKLVLPPAMGGGGRLTPAPVCPHRDILRVGVTLAGHQKKILNSVQMMRAQMNQIQSVEV